jgi:hypothetical protein
MQIKIQGKMVDVSRKDCGKRDCFYLLQDKGTFVQGRGYTSYHEKPRWVCGHRHLHGCPHGSVCPSCNTINLPGDTVCYGAPRRFPSERFRIRASSCNEGVERRYDDELSKM